VIVAAPADTLAASRLRRMARRDDGAERSGEQPAPEERCELCGESIPAEHRHLVDLSTRGLLCACRPCSLLFEQRGAGGGHLRLVPDRRLRIDDLDLDDALWARLRIPVDMAFFFRSSQAERVVAFYPGPMGATESQLELTAWEGLGAANQVLGDLETDVEALLVNRTAGSRSHWVVPIDDAYELVGVIRTGWKGLSGGPEVWRRIDAFFERLERRAKVVDRAGNRRRPSAQAVSGNGKEPTWGT
jgi:Family of unknown function (DUF5947)